MTSQIVFMLYWKEQWGLLDVITVNVINQLIQIEKSRFNLLYLSMYLVNLLIFTIRSMLSLSLCLKVFTLSGIN